MRAAVLHLRFKLLRNLIVRRGKHSCVLVRMLRSVCAHTCAAYAAHLRVRTLRYIRAHTSARCASTLTRAYVAQHTHAYVRSVRCVRTCTYAAQRTHTYVCSRQRALLSVLTLRSVHTRTYAAYVAYVRIRTLRNIRTRKCARVSEHSDAYVRCAVYVLVRT